jgi:hypothetical protein
MGGRGGVAAPSGKLGPGQGYDGAKTGRGGNEESDELYWSECYTVGERLFIGGSQVGGEELITEGMYIFVDSPNNGGKPGDVPITQFPPGTIIDGTYNVADGEGSPPDQVRNGGGKSGEYRINRSPLALSSPGTALGAGVGQTFPYWDKNAEINNVNRGSPSIKWQIRIRGSGAILNLGGGGGGGAGSGPQRGGAGGSGLQSSILGITRSYAAGGGGSHFAPNEGTAESGFGGAENNGRGSVNQGGDELFSGGTSPGNSSTTDGNGNPSVPSQTGDPLPPFGNKSGYGGPSGIANPAKNALNNRGGGGGGGWNGNSYNDWGPLANPRPNLWDPNANPPPNAFAPLWPTSEGTRNWPGRAGARHGGRGGSGIVIIKYPIVFGNVTTTGSPITTVTDNGFLVYQFVDSGSIKFDYTP